MAWTIEYTDTAKDQLQKLEVPAEGEGWGSDDGQRACFSRHDGQPDRPPGSRMPAQKIILEAALAFAKSRAEPGDRQQVDHDGGPVEDSHSAYHCIVRPGVRYWRHAPDTEYVSISI